MKAKRYVIIGAGQAGCNAGKALRSEDPFCTILLIGEEVHLPYERPQLSKGILAGTLHKERLYVVKPEGFEEHRIELMLSSTAEAIDPRTKMVSLANGQQIDYDKLLLTTGSRVRRLQVPGNNLGGIHYLRTLDHAEALHDHLAVASDLVIVGAGFIGLEIAAVAKQYKSCTVTIVEAGDMVLQRGVPEEMRAQIQELHQSNGVKFRFGKSAAAFLGNNNVSAVECQDGETIKADCVVVGIGVEPRTELAQHAGLAVQNGVVVNQYCETSTTDIYAAGEVTSHWNQQLNEFIRLESWQTAQLQPICAAQNMAGVPTSYNQIPWFWTDQFDINVQLIGVLSSGQRAVHRKYDRTRFVYFYFTNKKLRGAFGFNSGKDIRATQKMLEKDISPDPQELADPSQDMRKLLKAYSKKPKTNKTGGQNDEHN